MDNSMAIIKKRDRFVLFRLSQDEYEAIRAVCEKRAAPSISSFARGEILKMLKRDEPAGIAKQLSSLRSSVQRIIHMLEVIVPTTSPAGNQKGRRS
jgi:hypothetical protein